MPAYTNAKQVIPPLFQEILRNDGELQKKCSPSAVYVTKAFRKEWKELKSRKAELIRAAEKALKWNVDKGNTQKV